jgi:hypothetical protein
VAIYHALLGLAFDVMRDGDDLKPALIDLGARKELFGDVRLRGFQAALQKGIAPCLIIAGGDEGRYKDETPTVNRAEAIRDMLVRRGIPATQIIARASKSNTLGNVDIFADMVRTSGVPAKDFALITNLYHLPRAQWDMAKAGLHEVALLPAESAILYGMPKNQLGVRKEMLARELGGGAMAERIVEEAAGIADKLAGTYASRTDTVPVGLEMQKV